MNNSKKLLALLIALAMLVTFAAPTFAAGETDPETPQEPIKHKIEFRLSGDVEHLDKDKLFVYTSSDDTKTKMTEAIKGQYISIGYDSADEDEFEYIRGYDYFVDGRNIHSWFIMPDKDVVVEVMPKGEYSENIIFSTHVDEKPAGWVSIKVNAGDHGIFEVWGNEQKQKIVEFYVNPLHEVSIFYSGGRYTSNEWVMLNTDAGYALSKDFKLQGKFDKDQEITLEYVKVGGYQLTLEKYSEEGQEAEKQVYNMEPNATYGDVLNLINNFKTDKIEGKRYVGWFSSDNHFAFLSDDLNWFDRTSKISDKFNFTLDKNEDKLVDITLKETFTDKNLVFMSNKERYYYYDINDNRPEPYIPHSVYFVADGKKFDPGKYDKEHKNYFEYDRTNRKYNEEPFDLETPITRDYYLGEEYKTRTSQYKERDHSIINIVGEPQYEYDASKDTMNLDLTNMLIAILTPNGEYGFYKKFVPYKDFEKNNISLEPVNGTKLDAEDNGKFIKVTYKNGGKEYFQYTNHALKVIDDGFDKNNITEIKVKDQPQLEYEHKDDKKPEKFVLDNLVVILTSKSTKTGEEQKDVTRDVNFADFEKYGLKLSLKVAYDKDPVEIKKDSDVKLAYDKKKLTVSWKKDENSDPITEDTNALTVNDKVFRLENTASITKKTDPDTKYIVGDKLDLSKLVLTFKDENDNEKDFTYEELKVMGFNFELCGEDFKTDEEKAAEELAKAKEEAVKEVQELLGLSDDELDDNPYIKQLRKANTIEGLESLLNEIKKAHEQKEDEDKAKALEEAKKTAEEETTALTNLNDTEKAEFKEAIEAAPDEEAINKVKAEAKLKDDFIGAANAKFSGIKDKEGVYTADYDPTNRTVNVKILDKTKGARQISGTGLVANLFDLYKNNKLVKLQIGENRDRDTGKIQVLDLNALAELAKSLKPADQDEDNAIMNQFATIIGSQLLTSVQTPENNTGTLADFVNQSVDIKAMVLYGDIETEVVFKVNGIDGTSTPEEPAPTPAPGNDTEEPTPTEPGDDTEEPTPTEPDNGTEEPQPEEPVEPGEGGGGEDETIAPAGQCKPIENIDALELKDNAKKITITGPDKIKVADKEVDSPAAIKDYKVEIAITVEDKNKVEFAFESTSANKTLPTEVTSLLAANKVVDKDEMVKLEDPQKITVEVEDGKWTFKGWFVGDEKVTEVIASEKVTKVVGKWEFEEKVQPQPQPGGDDEPGTTPGEDDKPGQDPTRPFNPGYRYEPSPHYLKDTARRDERPVERKEEVKEEKKEEAKQEDIFKTLYFYLDKSYYEMEVNGSVNQIPMDVAPTAINQRTMLPIRYVAEAIGATVEWHQDTQSATFTKDGITATITLGSNIIQVSDGRQIVMDTEPVVIAERIFVPLTNISQIFGLTNGDLRDGEDNDIEWDQENYRVIIKVKEN